MPHVRTEFSPNEILLEPTLTNLIEPILPLVAAKLLQQIRVETLASNLHRAANQQKESPEKPLRCVSGW